MKILENKVSRKILENCFKIFTSKLGQRGTWDTPGRPTMPPHHMVAWAKSRPRHGMVWPLALHLFFHLPLHSLSQKNSTPLLKPMFLLFLLTIFDLLAQPIFAAEIWSICSLVCDSFDCPSRILFNGVFLEYFSTIGDRLSKFACLFYYLDKLF
jgi:hypothetical protein